VAGSATTERNPSGSSSAKDPQVHAIALELDNRRGTIVIVTVTDAVRRAPCARRSGIVAPLALQSASLAEAGHVISQACS